MLREVPQGFNVTVEMNAPAGIVRLREVAIVDGARMAVWDSIDAPTLRELLDVSVARSTPPKVSVVVRIIVDAAQALARVTPPRPHGGLSDDVLLVDAQGHVHVMDFGCPRPSRFAPTGPASVQNDAVALVAIFRASLAATTAALPAALNQELQQRFTDTAELAKALATATAPAATYEVAAFVTAIKSTLDAERVGSSRDAQTRAMSPIPMGTQPGRPPPEAFVNAPKSTSDATEPGEAPFAATVLRSRESFGLPPALSLPAGPDDFAPEKTVAADPFDERTVSAGEAYRPESERRDDKTVALRPQSSASERRDDRTVAQRPLPSTQTVFDDTADDLIKPEPRTVAQPLEPAPRRSTTPSIPLGASEEEVDAAHAKPPTRRERVERSGERERAKPAPRESSNGPSTVLITLAAVLACAAIGLVALVWRHRTQESVTAVVTPVRLDDPPVKVVTPVVPVAVGDDAGVEEDEADAGEEVDVTSTEPEVVKAVDAGSPTPKRPVKKKPPKRRRR